MCTPTKSECIPWSHPKHMHQSVRPCQSLSAGRTPREEAAAASQHLWSKTKSLPSFSTLFMRQVMCAQLQNNNQQFFTELTTQEEISSRVSSKTLPCMITLLKTQNTYSAPPEPYEPCHEYTWFQVEPRTRRTTPRRTHAQYSVAGALSHGPPAWVSHS